MSRQERINLSVAFRVIASGGGDSQTGAIACWGAVVPWWFVSRFVPLFPLAIHMQSQGLYTHNHTLAHTHMARKTHKGPPRGQSVLNRITAISHSVGGDWPQQKSNIYHVVLTPTAALHTHTHIHTHTHTHTHTHCRPLHCFYTLNSLSY